MWVLKHHAGLRRGRQRALSLPVEICERRLLLAGNVTAVFQGGTLTVTGDNAANVVDINVVNNEVIVQGFQGTTVNGSEDPYVVVAGNTLNDNLIVNLGNGKDVLSLRKVIVNRAVNIDLGAGNDRTVIDEITTNLHQLSDINVQSGLGKDQILISNVECGDDMVVQDAGGKTLIALEEVHAADDLFVSTGSGKQQILVDGGQVDDRMNISTPVGSGKDTIAVVGATVDRLGVNSGAGADVIALVIDTQNNALPSTVLLGSGNDSLVIGQTWQTPLTVDGESGNDGLYEAMGFAAPNGLVTPNVEANVDILSEDDVPQSFHKRVDQLVKAYLKAQAALADVLT